MKRFVPVMAALLAAAIGCDKQPTTVGSGPASDPAEAAKYAIVKNKTVDLTSDNTQIKWTASNPKGKHHGEFKKVSGTINVFSFSPGQQFKQLPAPIESLTVEIDAASLEADEPMLTNHLKSNDFFAAAEFPKIMFKSTKIVSVAEKKDECMITGDLKIRDKTVSITFPAKVNIEKTFFLESAFDLSRKEIGQTFSAKDIDDKVQVTVTVGKQMAK